jgi:hypothetical protein
MLSYMAPSVSDKPPTVPSRLVLEHKSATTTATAYHRFSRPPSITFNLHDGQLQHQREGFGALPVPPVRRSMVKEDSASSIASSVDVLPATHHDCRRPANKPATLKRSVFSFMRGYLTVTCLIVQCPRAHAYYFIWLTKTTCSTHECELRDNFVMEVEPNTRSNLGVSFGPESELRLKTNTESYANKYQFFFFFIV